MGHEHIKRPVAAPAYRRTKVIASTAPSTALGVEGKSVYSLESTSTTGPVAYTLAKLPVPGQELVFQATLVGATSVGAGYTVTAASGSFFGSSSEDVITMIDKP